MRLTQSILKRKFPSVDKPLRIKAHPAIRSSKRAFETFKPRGLFSEFYGMRRTRPCYISRGLQEAAELTARLRIFNGKRRRVAKEEQPIKIKVCN